MGSRTDVDGVSAQRGPMELYAIKLYPPCRAVWLYLLQHSIPHTLIDVGLSKNEKKPDFIVKNPHKEVPILVDGDVVVFEAGPILRYLGQQYTDFRGFGFTLPSRMLNESLISWATTDLHRVVGFCYAYPSYLEKYRLKDESSNEALMEHGMRELSRQLEQLETGYLAKQRYLVCGDRPTVADCVVATTLLQAEWVGFKFNMWPKVVAWLRRVRAQEYWGRVHNMHRELLREMDQAPFLLD